jgi:hypothetical protein
VAPCTHCLLPLPDPVQGEQPWTLEGPAGVETVVLLADEGQPWTDLPALLSRGAGILPAAVPLGTLTDPQRGCWFTCRQEEFAVSEKKGVNLAAAPVRDPIFQIHSFLRRQLGPHVRLIQAVSFANLGQGVPS